MESEPEVRRVLDAIDALGETGDPVERAKRLGKLLDEWPSAHARVRQARQAAVLELKAAGMTVRAIAAELELSPGRVQQILKGETTSAAKRTAKTGNQP